MQQRSILIGPPSQRPILESLLDLSAAGALEAFTWIEAGSDPASEADREDPRALRIADGQISSTTFSKSVNVRRLARLRIVILVPVGHPDADALTASAENFYQSLDIPGGASRVFVRVLIPWSAEPIAAELGRPGWNDVMLSPEGTAEPEFAAVPWWNDPLSIPGAAAAGVAVQAGLLPGLDEAPADDEKPGMSTDVPLARTFIRRIDAEAVESALKERVLRIDEQVPAPTRSTGSSVPPYASPENLIRDTAAVWTTRHEPSVRRPGPQIPQPELGDDRLRRGDQALHQLPAPCTHRSARGVVAQGSSFGAVDSCRWDHSDDLRQGIARRCHRRRRGRRRQHGDLAHHPRRGEGCRPRRRSGRRTPRPASPEGLLRALGGHAPGQSSVARRLSLPEPRARLSCRVHPPPRDGGPGTGRRRCLRDHGSSRGVQSSSDAQGVGPPRDRAFPSRARTSGGRERHPCRQRTSPSRADRSLERP